MYEVPKFTISMKADVALKAHTVVKATATGVDIATGAAGEVLIGIVQRDGILGEVVPVMVSGISMVVAGGSVTKGVRVAPTTDGQVIAATTNSIGVALEAASAKGDIIPVLLGVADVVKSGD